MSVVAPIGDKMVRRGECSEVPEADSCTAANPRCYSITFAWLKRMLDKKERDCKTALTPEKRRKR
jgi:hypothetical protein